MWPRIRRYHVIPPVQRPGSYCLILETIVIRFIFRLLAYIALSLAIIAAVLDAARSVGASQLTMTSLQDSWQSISPSSLALAETSIKTHIYPILWDPLMLWIFEAPPSLFSRCSHFCSMRWVINARTGPVVSPPVEHPTPITVHGQENIFKIPMWFGLRGVGVVLPLAIQLPDLTVFLEDL